MLITNKSAITGNTNTMNINITKDELEQYLKSSIPIQKFFPNLSADEREFIMTGITPQEWDDIFSR